MLVLCHVSIDAMQTTHNNLTSLLDIVTAGFPDIIVGHDSFLAFLPFYHIYGRLYYLFMHGLK